MTAGARVAAAFLFTDQVGSTALTHVLSLAEAEELRRTQFKLLRTAVDETGGIEVKTMGDGLMIMFPAATPALACAVAMQRAIERHNRQARVPVEVRIGLAAGEAVEEDGDYYGDAVVEAARLCGAGAAGQILATDLFRALVGRHAAHHFVPLGALPLKGVPDPVPAVEVLWEPVRATPAGGGGQPPLPLRLLPGPAEELFAFSGRVRQLEQLASARKRAATEAVAQVALVAGEPGVGKTALAARAAREAHAQGTTVLYGSCEEGLAVPYQPWIAALSPLVDHLSTNGLATHAERHGPVLARLLPALRRRLPDSDIPVPTDPETERFLLFEAIAGLLATASDERPVFVVLDDLHWADAASLQVLQHLAGSAGPSRLLVLGAYRDSDLSRTHPLTGLLADLRRLPSIHRLVLDGLADTELVELMETAAGHELPEEGVSLAHALRRETGGNPFFAVEILRHLAESGAIYQDQSGRYMLRAGLDEIGLPGSVREVIGRRVDRLGEQAVRLLSTAAVIGHDFDIDVLGRVADASDDELLDTLERALAAGLIAESEGPPPRHRFVHALIQHTLYQDLGSARRQRTHLRVAEALEDLSDRGPARMAELAHHWMAATRPAEFDKALHYARAAAEAAVDALAPDDAIRWYEQALELLGRQPSADERERCELLIGLGRAQCQASAVGYRDTLLEAASLARRMGDTGFLVAAALANTRGVAGYAATDPPRLEVLRAALDAVGETDLVARARLLAALVTQTDPLDWRGRRDLALEAISVARQVNDEPTLLATLNMTFLARAEPDGLAARLADTDEAIALADRLGDRVAGCQARSNRLYCCVETADLAEVDARLDEMAETVAQTRLPYLQWFELVARSWRLLLAGDTAAAETAALGALETGRRIGLPEALTVYGGQLFDLRRHEGRLDEIADLLARAVVDTPGVPALRAAVTDLHCELGHEAEALALLASDAATGFDNFPYDQTWLTAMVLCADAAAHLRQREAAARLYDHLAPFADRVAFNFGTVFGAVARPMGRLAALLGRTEDADSRFRAALEVHQRLGAPYWTARTQLEYADFLATRDRSGDITRAGQLVQAVRDTAERWGYGRLQRAARDWPGNAER